MKDTIVIHSLATRPTLEALQQLEMTVWQTSAPMPLHHTLTVAKNGGIILGAFHDTLMVGLLYSFPGYHRNQIYLCSHMLGVREGWRHHGIGARLKLAQAQAARANGYNLITWTYDPLETANGYLNIGKLGAVCATYIINCYGEMQDGINHGLPSDRFQVAWWINEPKPSCPTTATVDLINWQLNDKGFAVPVSLTTPTEASTLSVAVPAEFQAIKHQDISLAKAWREASRQAFTSSFADGWIVTAFQRQNDGVHKYILCRRSESGLPLEPWKKGEL